MFALEIRFVQVLLLGFIKLFNQFFGIIADQCGILIRIQHLLCGLSIWDLTKGVTFISLWDTSFLLLLPNDVRFTYIPTSLSCFIYVRFV